MCVDSNGPLPYESLAIEQVPRGLVWNPSLSTMTFNVKVTADSEAANGTLNAELNRLVVLHGRRRG